ncbi:MAG: GNAT family N-acetyltransferase [Anaerolineae bacterium]
MLKTERLTLRQIEIEDAPLVHEHMHDPAVTADLLPLRQPYTLDYVRTWIDDIRSLRLGEGIMFTILRGDEFIGTMYLHSEPQHRHAEIGYWFGKAYWGQGYATEAGRAVIRYGFERMFLRRIFAYYFARNVGSRRVLEKLGLKYEGTQRQDVLKDGVYHDISFCGLLLSEWELNNHDTP